MKLYLVRHGETRSIQQNLLTGWLNSPLTDRGIQQSEILADKLSSVKFDLILSSDLQGAKETAMIISNKIGALLLFEPLLRERGLGKLENQTKENRDWAQLNIENEENLTLGIESLTSIHERAKIFLEKLPQLFPSAQNILIVSHNGMINQFQKIWEPTHEFTPFEFLTILEKNL
ncbi:histidine phosphatase family protein [Lactococcus lactis subsp. lactis]|uniref:histidine phosphatase family protein n=1 Tax=Lactococcus lactis TaxID=1358 RepID=UPI000CE3AAD4|nr:histidine phosphatase family protein [Lactococcus lactis]MCU5753515.1 histidine phosphatase family protein [Lactococcus lactis]PPA67205.1 histidine phosphatase family protein [Lactococcus lactis]QQE99735.1 histidine phosphatase family protein [Lactococcus lactis]